LDSITQAVLGATVATVCVPKQQRRKAVLIGGMLGTLPDLDVLIDYGDDVANFTNHRGFSHSLFVLFPFSLLLWGILRRFYQPVKTAPKPWLLAISLTLITHALLDAHTAYGTQLFWPLSSSPVMWSTIFIIDPLYTVPLLIGIIIILIKPQAAWAAKSLAFGLIISTSYLAWTWTAKLYVEHQIESALVEKKESTRIFVTPTLFSSLLWRAVVIQDDQYAEAYYSFLNPKRSITFNSHLSNKALFDASKEIWAAQRLDWFTQGFIKTEIINDYLVISDLRMGYEGNYVFKHAVAKVDHPHIYEIPSKRFRTEVSSGRFQQIWDTLKKQL
jgi:inner membrane protein